MHFFKLEQQLHIWNHNSHSRYKKKIISKETPMCSFWITVPQIFSQKLFQMDSSQLKFTRHEYQHISSPPFQLLTYATSFLVTEAFMYMTHC